MGAGLASDLKIDPDAFDAFDAVEPSFFDGEMVRFEDAVGDGVRTMFPGERTPSTATAHTGGSDDARSAARRSGIGAGPRAQKTQRPPGPQRPPVEPLSRPTARRASMGVSPTRPSVRTRCPRRPSRRPSSSAIHCGYADALPKLRLSIIHI